ncbi:MAG: D-alanyl-D-alanine carboxypeptidase [Thioploca sp.]|nr:D-alanyl-D-alanine carboxypeptidase [Thioploca sp.]
MKRKFNSLLFSFILMYPVVIQANIGFVVPPAPSITARAYILQDFHSSETLMANNADERLEPASLTKLMTAYLIFQKLRAHKIQLTEPVKISETAWRMTGSRMYLEVGTSVTIEDLLQGMIIQSGNDASIALAEFVAGSEAAFVSLMNQQAQQLGLTNTHYTNSTGLPHEQHYSTAQDLAIMAKRLIQDFPEYYRRWYSKREFTYNNITQLNRNQLLWQDPTVDGVKTGYTASAGYCLISSAQRGNMRLIAVVMGSKNSKERTQGSKAMLDYGFRFFETYPLYQAKQPLTTERVWQGKVNQIQLGLMETLYVTLPKGQQQQLSASIKVDKYLKAPIEAGKPYGTLKINLGDQVIAKRPLTALASVELGQVWKNLTDSFLLLFY